MANCPNCQELLVIRSSLYLSLNTFCFETHLFQIEPRYRTHFFLSFSRCTELFVSHAPFTKRMFAWLNITKELFFTIYIEIWHARISFFFFLTVQHCLFLKPRLQGNIFLFLQLYRNLTITIDLITFEIQWCGNMFCALLMFRRYKSCISDTSGDAKISDMHSPGFHVSIYGWWSHSNYTCIVLWDEF